MMWRISPTPERKRERIKTLLGRIKFIAIPYPVTAYRLNYFFYAISKEIKKNLGTTNSKHYTVSIE